MIYRGLNYAGWSGVAVAFLIVLSTPTWAVSAEATKAPSKEAKSAKSWSQKMRNLEQGFQELLTDLSSDARFNSPKNFKRIEKNAEKFAKLAHELKVT